MERPGSPFATHTHTHAHTFGPLDEFDLADLFGDRFAPQHVETHNWPRLLQSLHRQAVSDLTHVHVIHKQNTVVNPERGREGERERERDREREGERERDFNDQY